MYGAIPTTSLVLPQNPPAPATTVIARIISGDNRIDPLLDNAAYRFNNGSPVGTPVTVTFSFPNQVPSSYSGEDVAGWKPFSEAQKAATREMMSLLQAQVNITFQEVQDSPTNFGTMRFSNNVQTNSGGYALLPNSSGTDRDSDTWIAISDNADLSLGTYNWMTLLHEMGHAIGLNHPGNYNAGESANVDAVGNFLSVNEDAFFNSIMSYRWSAQDIQDVWFMPYDMLALRYLYGTNPFNTGDTTYTLSDSAGKLVQNIVDDGGVDTLNFAAVPLAISLDMTPGAYSSVGRLISGSAALANLTISFDAVIENAIGTALSDSMIGNGANNVLTGGSGNDSMDGGAGTDTAVYSGNLANYTLTKTGGSYSAAANTGIDGTDTLSNIESLKFTDFTVNLEIQASAASIAPSTLQRLEELYVAFFNRIPDADGLAYWIGQFKNGSTVNQIADIFYSAGASATYSSLTGFSTSMTNTDFINVFYKNVLGRPEGADAGGLAYWSGKLADGSSSRSSLASDILTAAHTFKGDATYGWVANLLDNKAAVANKIAVNWGLNYNTDAYTHGVTIAAAVTSTSTDAAIALVGLTASDMQLG
jgi:hypothetical protein